MGDTAVLHKVILDLMNNIQMDTRQTIIAAILVLYFGKYLTRQIRFLREYNIRMQFLEACPRHYYLGFATVFSILKLTSS